MTNQMFDKKNIEKHIGTEVKFRKRLHDIKPLAEYFAKKCKQYKIEMSHDCTANENTYFKTLNYTTFAGMFMMHPLAFSPTMFQMYDAKADNLESVGHIDWVAENIKRKQAGKYTLGDGSEMNKTDFGDIKAVAVLAGSNKFYEHISKKKFQIICKRFGNKLVLKPHPITEKKIIGEIFENKGSAQMAGRHDDLYEIMEKVERVYTTHISETALTGLIMGKKVSPLDPFMNRLTGSFSHVNHFCFSESEPLKVLGSIFASPKSGIVHPDIDKDWKGKIDEYFEYIMAQREIQKSHYFE